MTPVGTKNRPKLLIWDFDGTLVDTNAAIMASAAAALGAHGAVADLGSAGSTIGLPLEELFLHAIPDAGEELVGQLLAAYRSDFDVHGIGRSALFPEIGELLDELEADGRACALATSRSNRSLAPLLDAFRLRSAFHPVCTHDDVDHPKPHPEMALTACRAAGIDPVDALVIGDTTYDMEMGRSAGTATCAVTWGNHTAEVLSACGPDQIVGSVAELRALLVESAGS